MRTNPQPTLLTTLSLSTEAEGGFLQSLLNLVACMAGLPRGLLEGNERQNTQSERSLKCQLDKREAAPSG